LLPSCIESIKREDEKENEWQSRNMFTSVASKRETFSTYGNHYTALGSSILSTMPGLDNNRKLKRLLPTALSLPFEVFPNLMTTI
jgi:hypothetical protein